MADNNKIKCNVRVQHVKFYKDGFGIVCVKPVKLVEGYKEPTVDKYGEFIIKGNVPKLELGEIYAVTGKEVTDPNWGIQVQVVFMSAKEELNDSDKQRVFLSKILTSNQLEALYKDLPNPFETIKNEDIESLTGVKGIGLTIANRLITRYKETIDYSDAYIRLDSIGLTDGMIKKMCDAYGSPQVLIEKFEENPYILCDDINGIGFKRADDFAIKYGIDRVSPKRIKAFIKYHLESQANMGNTWNHTGDLVNEIFKILGNLDKKIVGDVLKECDFLWWSDNKTRVGLVKYHKLESKIADELVRLLKAENKFEYDNWKDDVKKLEDNLGFEYTDEQKNGVKKALDSNVVIITGLSGTGKTTITKAILETLKTYYFAQTALSGKASQRMAEVTGYEAQTIHRLLEYLPRSGFSFDKDNRLPHDIVIIDETSMVGADLFYSLVQAIKTGSKLVILGDYGQLPSIGTGNVFFDMINSGVIPLVKLTQIHRQAQKSAVITESIKLRGQQQIFEKGFTGKKILGELQDLELDIYADKTETAKKILMQFKEKLPTVKSIMDIQIIVPMKERGDACTFRLNNAIQTMYNKDGNNEIEIFISKDKKYKLREGDKVIISKNNYKTFDVKGKITPVFNGNMGIIEKINEKDNLIVINFENLGHIIIEKKDWNTIQLGYAITAHKFQGSQAHTIIVGLDYSSYMSLSCEWLYTAITRTQKYCVLCGENKAIRYAVTVSNVPDKKTFLFDILRNLN